MHRPAFVNFIFIGSFSHFGFSGCRFISLGDLQNLLGNSTEYVDLEKVWRESLGQCTTALPDRITYDEFKTLMKGQPKTERRLSGQQMMQAPRSEPFLDTSNKSIEELVAGRHRKQRSRSHEVKTGLVWDDLERAPSIALLSASSSEFRVDPNATPLETNRAIYRRHREMRLAILEASKQFDKKRLERNKSQNIPVQAGLIMTRSCNPPLELEDAHTEALYSAAARRCGRSRRSRNKTVSDVTGMLLR